MARPNQEAIDTFMSITGLPEATAVQKLEEHHGDLNEAVNAHFSEGGGNIARGAPISQPEDDLMDIDDPVETEPRESNLQLPGAARTINPFSILDPNFSTNLFGHISDRTPQPSEMREVPVEVRNSNELSGRSGHFPTIEDLPETVHADRSDTGGTVIINNEDDENIPAGLTAQNTPWNGQNRDFLSDSSHTRRVRPSAPAIDTLPDDSNDIEEEMIRAAIEASKQGTEESTHAAVGELQSHSEDPELAHAVSLSLKTAEEENLLRGKAQNIGASKMGSDVQLEQIQTSNGRLEAGSSSSFQDDAEDVEEQALVRNTTRRVASRSMGQPQNDGGADADHQTSFVAPNVGSSDQTNNSDAFTSNEWGGISSEEHDEAVMLEAALFGGIPESVYQSSFASRRFNELLTSEDAYAPRVPRPPSPSLEAQRLIREQQDDEYLASLQADREKEEKAIREAEDRRLEEEAARNAALEEERQKEEEARRKIAEEQEFERQLAAKEASLPQEPAADEENAVTLLVRMPDGSRHGRRFLKSDKLQSLFHFIDIGRAVEPGTYRLVRPYPRRAFGDGESGLTLNELGLTSKQEALFLELI